MTVTTVAIVCDITLADNTEFPNAQIRFTPSQAMIDAAGNDVIPPHPIIVDLNASGVGTANLWPVSAGAVNSHYAVELLALADGSCGPKLFIYALGIITPPATGGPFNLADLLAQTAGGITIGSVTYATLSDAVAAALAAALAAADAQAATVVALNSAGADLVGRPVEALAAFGVSGSGLPETYSSFAGLTYGSDAVGPYVRRSTNVAASSVFLRAVSGIPGNDNVFRVTARVRAVGATVPMRFVLQFLDLAGTNFGISPSLATMATDGEVVTMTMTFGRLAGGLVTVPGGNLETWDNSAFIRFGVRNNVAAPGASFDVLDLRVEDVTSADQAARQASASVTASQAAAASANDAGQQASAAATERAAAETARAAAETFRNQSAAAAENADQAAANAAAAQGVATGAATTAGQQAGIATGAAGDAQTAASASVAASQAAAASQGVATDAQAATVVALNSAGADLVGRPVEALAAFGVSGSGLPETYSAFAGLVYGSDAVGPYVRRSADAVFSSVFLRAVSGIPGNDNVFRVTARVRAVGATVPMRFVLHFLNSAGANVAAGSYLETTATDGEVVTMTMTFGRIAGGLVTVLGGTLTIWDNTDFIRVGVRNHVAAPGASFDVLELRVEDVTSADQAARQAGIATAQATIAVDAVASIPPLIVGEEAARISADNALADDIVAANQARVDGDQALSLALADETAARLAGDGALSDVLDQVTLPPDTIVPAQTSEAVIITGDGYELVSRAGDLLRLGGAVDIALSDADPALTVPTFVSGESTIAGAFHDPSQDNFSIVSDDSYPIMRQNPNTGALEILTGPGSIRLPGSLSSIPGVVQPGAVTDVSRQGDIFQYVSHGPAFGGRVMGRDMGDWGSPHIPLCADLEIIEGNGQSWAVELELAANLDFSDPTGRTRAAMEAAITPEVSLLRRADRLSTIAAPGDYSNVVATISNNNAPGELHRFDGGRFNPARAAALCATIQRKRLGLVALPQVVLECGWPGTSHRLFLPPDTTVEYTNDAGVASSFTSESHPDAGNYLWLQDLARRAALNGVIENRWPEFSATYRFVSWVQGAPDDANEYIAFLNAWRVAQDDLGLGQRHLIIDQNNGLTGRILQRRGVQGQLEWAQANASGRDWLASPRYPFSVEDTIHHSAFGTLEYAERVGQAMAHIDRYGSWEPLWVTGVVFDGATATLTINQPRQTHGDLVIDDETIPVAANHGFSLHQTETNSAITINAVTVGANTVTLTASAHLIGLVEVGYAVRGVTRPAGTTAAPSFVGTIGNIKRRGRDAPAIIPASVRPELDHWLCQYRKTHEV